VNKIVAIIEILSSFNTVIRSISNIKNILSSNQDTETRDRGIVDFLSSWDPLLDQLRFSKDVHNSFQDLEFNFRQYIKASEDKSPEIMSEAWGSFMRPCYQKKIDDLVRSLPENNQVSITQIEEEKVPISIRKNVKLVSGQYQQLITALGMFAEKYEAQEAEINDQRFMNFKQYNRDLRRNIDDVLSRADKIILNLVPILIENYETIKNG
jgi:hypothetical protein